MCGIIAVVGKRPAKSILLDGLKALEYRGYDSAGLAILNGELHIRRQVGPVQNLIDALVNEELAGTVGMAHTRWATHGEPTIRNTHPHVNCWESVAVIHNGIIENHTELRRALEDDRHTFTSDTDSEVLAHLIGEFYTGDLTAAVRGALKQVTGTYGLAVMHRDHPGTVVGARNCSPLMVGVGDGECFLTSDVRAVLPHTRSVVDLDDHDVVTLTDQGYTVCRLDDGINATKPTRFVDWDIEAASKGDYEHYMLKEIFEQPDSIRNALRGRLDQTEWKAHFGGLNLADDELQQIKRIVFLGCGTSWHAGLLGEYLIEGYARIPVEVEYASEFRYRRPVVEPGTIVFVVSQSGETIDTLAAMREAQKQGAKALGIVNVVGSTIAREADGGVFLHAGPEIGVASTKAFTSQATVIALLTLLLGRQRKMSVYEAERMVKCLLRLPSQVEEVLATADSIKTIAQEYYHHNNFLYLGRGPNFPVALEGALKLKEISYVHAEGYPAAEMKHGPIALIDENMPVVVIATQGSDYQKILGNIEEIKARKGRVIGVISDGDTSIHKLLDHAIVVPPTLEMFAPILSVIPLQLLAYHIAVLRGCNVDRPRNLAKAVAVE